MVCRLSVVFVLFVWPWTSVQAQTFTAADVPLYKVFETTVANSGTYGNKFRDVVLNAVFTSPSGIAVPFWGFYDGDGNGGQVGKVWKLRFMPTEKGEWTYNYTWSDGTPGGSGKFSCIEKGAGKPTLQPYQKNNRWVAYGGTEPVMLRAYYPGKMTNTDLQWSIEHVYQPLIERGYNQFMMIGTLYGWPDHHWKDAPADKWSSEHCGWGDSMNLGPWKLAESHFRWLEEKNVTVHHWSSFGGGSRAGTGWKWEEMPEAERELHIRYIMARLAPMAGQTGWGYGYEITAPADFMELLKKYDPWNHLRGGQNLKDDVTSTPANYTWMNHSDGSILYTPDGFHKRTLAVWDRLKPKMPLNMNETKLWHCVTKNGEYSDTAIRRHAWAVATAGCYFTWNWASTEVSPAWAYSDKLLASNADEYLNVLYNTFEKEVKLGDLVPRDGLVSSSSSGPTWAMSGGGQYLVFDQDGGGFRMRVEGGTYVCSWISAISGKKKTTVIRLKSGVQNFSAPDATGDWVLVLRRKE